MLHITVLEAEEFNNATQEFVSETAGVLVLEHSLVSLSKWESKFEKPFINQVTKTDEETIAYFHCMDQGADTPPELFTKLSQKNVDDIQAYIDAKMTATWFSEEPKKGPGGEAITSELIYYWMISLDIPFECQDWHLNRLLTLIQVCNRKNAPARKMSKSEIIAKQRELNAQRRAASGSSG